MATHTEALTRLMAEYREMPGLCLTSEQAGRLFGLDREVCGALLRHLVEEGYLRETERGRYVAATAA